MRQYCLVALVLGILPATANVRVFATEQQNESRAKMMETDRFWWIIELTRESSKGEPAEQLRALREQLHKLTAAEVAEFQLRFYYTFAVAYHNDLWAVAYIAHGGCGDDNFIDFRYWLISRGRVICERAMNDPDSLAEVPGVEDGFFEEFGYVARQVYEEQTGVAMRLDQRLPDAVTKLKGHEWDEEDEADLRKRFPNTWHKFRAN